MPPHRETQVVKKQFPAPLHIGTESELGGIELVLLRRSGAGWTFVNIAYDQQVVEGLSLTPVNKIPYAQIKVEGAAKDPRFGTPEHVGGPLNTGSEEHRIAREALHLLVQRIAGLTSDGGVSTVSVNNKAYRPLDRAIDRYNLDLEQKANAAPFPLVKATWRRFKLRTTRPDNAVWHIRKRDIGSATKVGTQVNIELPFTSIGQRIGNADLAEQFGSNEALFRQCRQAACGTVRHIFAVERAAQKKGTVFPEHVKLYKLNSLFTLYYYAVVMQWQIKMAQERIQVRLHALGEDPAARFEQSATSNKSKWQLLPKVKWGDLYENAISSHDRDLLKAHMKDARWTTLKNRMTTDLLAIINPSDQQKCTDHCNKYHDELFKSVTWWFDSPKLALSSTGKPLPVSQMPVQKETITQRWNALGQPAERPEAATRMTTEAIIVFEVRMSGDVLQKAGKPEDSANPLANMQQVVDTIKRLQWQ
jgi:hypothetical protein